MILRYVLLLILITLYPSLVHAQDLRNAENVRAKGRVIDESTIKLRWAPANTKAWNDGRKYGYTVERYTMIIDTAWQNPPIKNVIGTALIPLPLAQWEEHALKSDYAAVIAQAFYGDDFELSPSNNNDIASIINQASELEQRFATSLFVAEYDFKASEMAGWGWTDRSAKKNETYLYRIILNREKGSIPGDTTAVLISYKDKRDLPKPLEVTAIFSDKSVMLSWEYKLLSSTYHSYHVERKAENETGWSRITDLPVTALSEDMNAVLYTDSLANNEMTYSYRITGLTSFDEVSPYSDVVSGKGKKSVSCVPHITYGEFVSENKAQVIWEFECKDIDLVSNFEIKRSAGINNDYKTLVEKIPLDKRELEIKLTEETNYVKIHVVNKDGSHTESYPFLIKQIDSIPPAIPTGLKVEIDSLGIAHLSWNANKEADLRGYRILRSFTKEGEKSTILSDFLTETIYADTLSLTLGNPKVYYAISALDIRYNESEPCLEVVAEKPNMATPANPVFTDYKVDDGKVYVSWMTEASRRDVQYSLKRICPDYPGYNKIVFTGDFSKNSFEDEVPDSGDYEYIVVAQDKKGKTSQSPQPVKVYVKTDTSEDEVSGLTSYVDTKKGYIELSWRKHSKADFYRIYKKEGEEQMSLWKEIDASHNRIVDEYVSVGNIYTYTIQFIPKDGNPSKAKSILVEY